MIEDVMNEMTRNVVNAHEEIIKKLIAFTGVKLETTGPFDIEKIKREMMERGYEIISDGGHGVEQVHLLHKGKKIMSAEIKQEMKLDEGKFIVTHRFIRPDEEEGK